MRNSRRRSGHSYEENRCQIPKALIEVRDIPSSNISSTIWLIKAFLKPFYASGHKGEMIRDYLKSHALSGIQIDYVNEGDNLKGQEEPCV